MGIEGTYVTRLCLRAIIFSATPAASLSLGLLLDLVASCFYFISLQKW